MKTAAAAVAAALLALALLSTASASTLTVYTAIGCGGNSNTYNGCGCFNLTMFGGYDFVYTGQPLEIYERYNCESQYGPSVINESFRSCAPIKFDRSIRLPCTDNCLHTRADN